MRKLLSLACFLVAAASFGAVGDLVGYEEIEATLRSRFFLDAPFCVGTPEHVAEFKRVDALRDPIVLKVEEINFWFLSSEELGLKPGFILTGVLGDFKPQKTSLAHLLGTRYYPDVISLPLASNHVVNSQNMFAWDLVLTELAIKLGGVCRQVKQGEINLGLTLQDSSLLFEECRVRKVSFNASASQVIKNVCNAAESGDKQAFEDYAEELYDMASGFDFPEEEQKAWSDMITSQGQMSAEDRLTLMFRTIFLNPYFMLQR